MRLLNTCEMENISGSGVVDNLSSVASFAKDLIVGLSGATVSGLWGVSALSANKKVFELVGIPGGMGIVAAHAVVGYYGARCIQEWFNASYNNNYSE